MFGYIFSLIQDRVMRGYLITTLNNPIATYNPEVPLVSSHGTGYHCADQATSHYLNQWWLAYWRTYVSLGLNELISDIHIT